MASACRDAKFCVSRARNAFIGSKLLQACIAMGWTGDARNEFFGSKLLQACIAMGWTGDARNALFGSKLLQACITMGCLWDARFCVSTLVWQRGKDGGFMRQDLMATQAFLMILHTEKRRMRTVTVTCGIIKKSLPAKCGERLKVFLWKNYQFNPNR